MTRSERVTNMQDVYDLIIATCQYNPEFHAWGASALRYLNRAAIADTRPKDGDALAAPLASGGGAKQSPITPCNQTTP